ncbi:hypothetical protein Nepgr_014062 [Nepenthes gracilis]|uniref:Clp R domain-containing protein n=1 Tax=Nepenthes gracilis TaxID=150966 RepID=A0AAD3SKV2_NEPGR|nr:hypothetical protein Nepgr_014062 [Nepenthes gracilis]
MPTPVCTARQCLTDEAARALDDAVSVARRRNHAQTTSLHVVSALLSLPSSLLREACSRARSAAYSQRLQFRALELSVGVSLDRIPCSKNQDDVPPISNSLMAAIKRSQANQRRQPEMYHLSQLQHQNGAPMSILSIKVELKQFLLSILDDPIVSKVLGEAGFRSCDIKLAIVHPPVCPPVRYLRSRCPPLFLCNLTDSGYPVGRNLPFPFLGAGNADGDAYRKRIGEVLVKKSGRNPLLVGGGAKDALNSFKECLVEGKGADILPSEILELDFVCLEEEIAEYVRNGGDEEMMGLMIKELKLKMERNSGPGVIVNFGELEALVDDSVPTDAVECLVLELSSLVELYKRLWLIGVAANYETYRKLVERFPSVEKDWDLQPLPITSTRSSLMRSFVPFGGFFSAPSEFRNSIPVVNRTFSRCNECNQKYERECSAIMKGGPSVSISDHYSATLPLWLQMAGSDPNKAGDVVTQAKDEKAVASNAKILGLQKKWNDICQRLHWNPTISKPGIYPTRPEVLYPLGFQFAADKQGNAGEDMNLNEKVCSGFTSCMPVLATKTSSQKQDGAASFASLSENADSSLKLAIEASKSLLYERDSSSSPTSRLQSLGLPCDRTSCSSSSLTTDLGLGSFCAYKSQELHQLKSQENNRESLQKISNSISIFPHDTIKEKISDPIGQPRSSAGLDSRGMFDPVEYKSLFRDLTKIVGRQDEAIRSISQIVSSRRSRNGPRRDIWMIILGPDKMGKRRIAEALADVVFCSRENLVAVDLSCHRRITEPNAMFSSQGPSEFNKVGRNTIVGYIVEELNKKPQSVIFLENVDEADLMVQNSLSHAIQTGKFPDSHGREISIINTIFVISTKYGKNLPLGNESVKFSEQMILEAKNWQMQIMIKSSSESHSSENGALNKRKLSDAIGLNEHTVEQRIKVLKNHFDLNLPLEEIGETTELENLDCSSTSDSSRAWLDDFSEQVDGKVVFEPFNFDALAYQLMKKISSSFEKKLGLGMRLEIDHEAMIEMLAAAWSSSRKGAVEDWIEQVLVNSFEEAQKRYGLTAQSIVKLVACIGHPAQEQAHGICLPSRIDCS